MGSITPEQIEHIARLAKLRFSPEEMGGFSEQFNQIIAYIEKLNEVDARDVEPLASVFDATDTLRDDEPGPMLPPAKALQNAPMKTEGFFSVPKVIGDNIE